MENLNREEMKILERVLALIRDNRAVTNLDQLLCYFSNYQKMFITQPRIKAYLVEKLDKNKQVGDHPNQIQEPTFEKSVKIE